MIPPTVPEVRRLLIALVWPLVTDHDRAWARSRWRRRHQAAAMRCHYRRRGDPLSAEAPL